MDGQRPVKGPRFDRMQLPWGPTEPMRWNGLGGEPSMEPPSQRNAIPLARHEEGDALCQDVKMIDPYSEDLLGVMMMIS